MIQQPPTLGPFMKQTRPIVTRFAPSPTGHLHLGHAYSAWLNMTFATSQGGRFLLRIEDIDSGRCRPEYTPAILEDLTWLGLRWEDPVRLQSQHMHEYQAALDRLDAKDLLYPCFCTRKEIRESIREKNSFIPLRDLVDPDLEAHSNEGPVYPGTCRHLTPEARAKRHQAGTPFALRLNMARALEQVGTAPLVWTDLQAGEQTASADILLHILGDAVLARKDIATSYHMAVVVDDHHQNISHVIRGQDLFLATHLHRLLQHLLDYPTPLYHHHELLTDDKGWRFAKRDNSKSLHQMREEGLNPQDLLKLIRP